MSTSDELMEAFSQAGPEVLGKKKWKRLLFAVHRRLEEEIPENGAGPIIAARRDAMMVLRYFMRKCLSSR